MIFKKPERVRDFADSRFERFPDYRMAAALVYGAQGLDFTIVVPRHRAIGIRCEKFLKQILVDGRHIAGNNQVRV
jgi:hypothetical protein